MQGQAELSWCTTENSFVVTALSWSYFPPSPPLFLYTSSAEGLIEELIYRAVDAKHMFVINAFR